MIGRIRLGLPRHISVIVHKEPPDGQRYTGISRNGTLSIAISVDLEVNVAVGNCYFGPQDYPMAVHDKGIVGLFFRFQHVRIYEKYRAIARLIQATCFEEVVLTLITERIRFFTHIAVARVPQPTGKFPSRSNAAKFLVRVPVVHQKVLRRAEGSHCHPVGLIDVDTGI